MRVFARFFGALCSDGVNRDAAGRPHWTVYNVYDCLGSMLFLVFCRLYLGDDD
jgi:hypothetical protein